MASETFQAKLFGWSFWSSGSLANAVCSPRGVFHGVKVVAYHPVQLFRPALSPLFPDHHLYRGPRRPELAVPRPELEERFPHSSPEASPLIVARWKRVLRTRRRIIVLDRTGRIALAAFDTYLKLRGLTFNAVHIA